LYFYALVICGNYCESATQNFSTKNSILLRTKKELSFTISKIKCIKRKKVSALMIIDDVTFLAVGTVISLDQSDNNKEDTDAVPTPNN
jgi:hypothetical protein